jgi:hypothetical protein
MVLLWMKDTDEVVEQPIWMEGCFLIERTQLHIAAIDLMLTESLELIVAMIL